jgi:hypothetical protein
VGSPVILWDGVVESGIWWIAAHQSSYKRCHPRSLVK